MAKSNPGSITADTAERIQENVHNLPITSVALAGLLGAGITALLLSLGLLARRNNHKY